MKLRYSTYYFLLMGHLYFIYIEAGFLLGHLSYQELGFLFYQLYDKIWNKIVIVNWDSHIKLFFENVYLSCCVNNTPHMVRNSLFVSVFCLSHVAAYNFPQNNYSEKPHIFAFWKENFVSERQEFLIIRFCKNWK